MPSVKELSKAMNEEKNSLTDAIAIIKEKPRRKGEFANTEASTMTDWVEAESKTSVPVIVDGDVVGMLFIILSKPSVRHAEKTAYQLLRFCVSYLNNGHSLHTYMFTAHSYMSRVANPDNLSEEDQKMIRQITTGIKPLS